MVVAAQANKPPGAGPFDDAVGRVPKTQRRVGGFDTGLAFDVVPCNRLADQAVRHHRQGPVESPCNPGDRRPGPLDARCEGVLALSARGMVTRLKGVLVEIRVGSAAQVAKVALL